MDWHLHDLFARLPPDALDGGIAIVIDVLRATSTIATALAHGAVEIRPVVSVAEARAKAAATGSLLGGERGGLRVAGFDLGNSPREYTAERVAGRSLVITTTNGTAALAACRGALEVFAGAIVNRAAVATAARAAAGRQGSTAIHLVCAGTDAAVTEEDVLAAGAILDAAAGDPAAGDDRLDEAARAARTAFRAVLATCPEDPAAAIARDFAAARGGKPLLALGMAADLAACARLDAFEVVPRFDPATGILTAAQPECGRTPRGGMPDCGDRRNR